MEAPAMRMTLCGALITQFISITLQSIAFFRDVVSAFVRGARVGTVSST